MKPQRVFYGRLPAPMEPRYGRLRVLDRAGTHPHGEILYLCRCDCGTRRTVRGGSLRAGRTTSCGTCARPSRPAHNVAPVAEVYGRLRVLERAGRTREGEALYRCVCACGATVRVRSGHLRDGRTQSCGCLRAARVKAAKRRRAFQRRAALWFRGEEGRSGEAMKRRMWWTVLAALALLLTGCGAQPQRPASPVEAAMPVLVEAAALLEDVRASLDNAHKEALERAVRAAPDTASKHAAIDRVDAQMRPLWDIYEDARAAYSTAAALARAALLAERAGRQPDAARVAAAIGALLGAVDELTRAVEGISSTRKRGVR